MLRKVTKSGVRSQKSGVLRDLLLSLSSAILLVLSFPGFNIEILAWVGFVPVFFALKNKSRKEAFFLFFITGIIFWWGIIYWLVHVTVTGTILLVLYLALYFGIFGLIISSIQHPRLAGRQAASSIQLLFLPSIWVTLEYLRSHLFTGFPWALLGHSQYLNLPVIQIADITGAWGVSFLVMMSNVMIYSVIGYRLSVIGGKQKYLLPILCILVTLTYGYYKIYRTPNTEHRTPIKISVIQGNIPQELKWNPGSEDFIVKKYLTLTTEVKEDKPDLIVWPEAAMPVVLQGDCQLYERIQKFIEKIQIPILLGAVTLKEDRYYNSALLISGNGKLLSKYDKLHLVPFGEYVPLKNIFRFLETVVPIGDFSQGKDYTIFKVPSTEYRVQSRETQNNFAVLICFEDLFPQLSREFIKRGADFLINITNDAWFKKTTSPYQHLQASVFRAVENRVYLIRSANTGISGFIAPTGKILSLVHDKASREIFISGYSTKEIFIAKKNLSFYTRYGDVFVIICFLFIFYGAINYVKYHPPGNN
jgi:apolipoprotein N-acyltransferase